METFYRPTVNFPLILAVSAFCCACTPRVEVALPDKPIEININAKIDHEVRIKVEKDVQQLLAPGKRAVLAIVTICNFKIV